MFWNLCYPEILMLLESEPRLEAHTAFLIGRGCGWSARPFWCTAPSTVACCRTFSGTSCSTRPLRSTCMDLSCADSASPTQTLTELTFMLCKHVQNEHMRFMASPQRCYVCIKDGNDRLMAEKTHESIHDNCKHTALICVTAYPQLSLLAAALWTSCCPRHDVEGKDRHNTDITSVSNPCLPKGGPKHGTLHEVSVGAETV